MDVDDEDLPAVNLNSPRKNAYLRNFHMPDASILAAQRKLEDEQDTLVRQIMSRDQEDITDVTLNISQCTQNTSHFFMPDADLIASNRKLEFEKDLLIDNLLKEHEIVDNTEIALCLESLQLGKSSLSIPNENPGIDINQLDIQKLLDCPSKIRKKFMENFFKTVAESTNEEHLQLILDHLLITLVEMYSDKKISKTFEDMICHILLVCAIILDKNCRLVYTSLSSAEVLNRIIEKIPPSLQNPESVERLSNQILTNFNHFHDRLHLTECIIIKCHPADIDTDPLYFSSRLAKHILHKSLCQLVGFAEEDHSRTCGSFTELKIILSKGDRVNKLVPYEQYIMMKLANELQWMFVTDGSERLKENGAQKWILTFFNSLKRNNNETKSTDFFKVKSLCSRINLLWQMDSEDFET